MACTVPIYVFSLVLLLIVPVYRCFLIAPGIFNPKVCNTDLRHSEHVTPLCDCLQKNNVTELQDLCRVSSSAGQPLYHVIGDCVEGGAHPESYLGQVFSQKQFVRSFKYLCDKFEDMRPDIETCWSKMADNTCDDGLINHVNTTDNSSQKRACWITNEVRLCYWQSLKCPARDKHFISKLSEAYLSHQCIQYFKESVADKCQHVSDSFLTEQSDSDCLDGVDMMKECFMVESLESTHADDRVMFTGFDFTRYVYYSKMYCRFEKEEQCTEDSNTVKYDACVNLYFSKLDGLAKRFLTNTTLVAVNEICREYDSTFQCFDNIKNLSKGCRKIFQAYLCARSPGSCHCPIIEGVALDSKSVASIPQTLGFIVMMLVYFLLN